MRRIPYRQFQAWMLRIEEQTWEEPSRSDHYVMALTRMVHSVFEKPGSLGSYKLKFQQSSPADVAARIKRSKSMWVSALVNAEAGPRPDGKPKIEIASR